MRRLFRYSLVCLLAFCLVCAGAYLLRAPLLKAAAHAWIVDDSVATADAIVILGGGLEYRPFAAAALFTNGRAPKVLIAQVKPAPTARMGLTLPEFEVARQVLVSNGVPASAIESFGTNVTNTHEEAEALRAWAQRARSRSLLIPTELFHTRRARWAVSRAMGGTGAEVHVVPVAPPQYSASDWWQHEEGLIAFQNEVVKSAYYRLKY